jgi:cysteinyl-tRNA synthetase
VDPLAFRYLTLTTRYRHKLEYTPASLGAAAAGLESLRTNLRWLGPPPTEGPWAAPGVLSAGSAGDRPDGTVRGATGHGGGPAVVLTDRAHEPAARLSAAGLALHDRFVAALDDDLDLPTALAVVREIGRAALDNDEQRWLLLDAEFVLGLGLDRVWEAVAAAADDVEPGDVRELVGQRSVARAAGDYVRADALRDEIADRGWEVVDEAAGPKVRRR